MARRADDIRKDVKNTRQQIEDTLSAMTEKLAILEERGQETVDAVKHTFDLHYQVKQRPWVMFGGALLVGYMLGNRGSGNASSAIGGIKGAAVGAVISTLGDMVKQALRMPPAKKQ
jgi:ElaB/YqjD/DUF883 family membrane-anchored ribosome-binding protein